MFMQNLFFPYKALLPFHLCFSDLTMQKPKQKFTNLVCLCYSRLLIVIGIHSYDSSGKDNYEIFLLNIGSLHD
jgi:hypothetical protein